MQAAAFWTSPLPDRKIPDLRILLSAAVAQLARRKRLRYLHQDPAMIRHLVFQHPIESAPRDVSDRLGQLMVPHHPLHIQILHADDLVLVRQPAGHFMQKVFSDVRCFLVFSRKSFPGLLQ